MPTSKNSHQVGVVFSKNDKALLEEIRRRVGQLDGLQSIGGFVLHICRHWHENGAEPVSPTDKAMQIQAGKWPPKKK